MDKIGIFFGTDTGTTRLMAKKMAKSAFTLDDFRDQLQQLKKMGSLDSLLGMIPGMGNKLKGLKNMTPDAKELKQRIGDFFLHKNPLRKGLVRSADEWHYSSAADWHGTGQGPIPIDFDSFPT